MKDSFLNLPNGIYEQLITKLFEEKLTRLEKEHNFYIERKIVDAEEAALYLSRFLQSVLQTVFGGFKNSLQDEQTAKSKLEKQIELANELIYWLRDYLKEEELAENLIDAKGQLLKAIFSKQNPVSSNLTEYVTDIFPHSGLTQSDLFTGSNTRVSLDTEIKREIASSDEIWWLVSFIKWSGIRIFREQLKRFTDSGKKLKIITTSYMGATDLKAVEELAKLPNTEIKLSFNHNQERLHAKSYLFIRNSGFDTGYIGSSNLSHAAMTNGLEWNIKITTKEIPHVIKKFKSTFETYWESKDFETYVYGNEHSKQRLKTSLQLASGKQYEDTPLFFNPEPHPYQREMLEKLDVERNVHSSWRNLVVAATGTGKTIIAAFDFRKFVRNYPGAKLLFVAHREEILKQARFTFQHVLRDSNFGELWVGGNKPEHYNQLFASVQTLNNQLEYIELTPDFFDVVIIDEVHHIAAESYRPILNRFNPKILLGLTATPERNDGTSILPDFNNRIAVELRLPDAINRRYLCPFHYFGVDDTVDLDNVEWRQGKYVASELTRLYTQNDFRFEHILRNMEDILLDIHSIKCLAFCVSQDHAQYMAEKFLFKGIKAAVLTSRNSDERETLRKQLVIGELNILCVVDIFNEGVDIPEIDTVLFLRPTESLTVFLQQLGRGLRLADKKENLTVLDFVGNAREEYDFTSKFRSLVGKTHQSIENEIEQDFPHLPIGCSIVLQRKAKDAILDNIRRAIVNQRSLIRWISTFELNSHLPLTLENFLNFYPNITLHDLYKIKIDKGGGWNRLLIQAEKSDFELNPEIEQAIYKGISRRVLTGTSRSYIQFIAKLFNQNGLWDSTSTKENQLAIMIHYDFWQKDGEKLGFSSLKESLQKLTSDRDLKREVLSVCELHLNQLDTIEYEMRLPNTESALKIHARYSRDAILASFSESSFEKQSSSREGVVFIKSLNTELLFVTLNKSEKHFSPTTSYQDYAISEELFHWQSQNATRENSPKGESYKNHKKLGKTILLFVREQNSDEFGRTMGFINLGPVSFVSSTGSQPMNITWKLDFPLPNWLWTEAAKLAVG